MNSSKVDRRKVAMAKVYALLVSLAEKAKADDTKRPATEQPVNGKTPTATKPS